MLSTKRAPLPSSMFLPVCTLVEGDPPRSWSSFSPFIVYFSSFEWGRGRVRRASHQMQIH